MKFSYILSLSILFLILVGCSASPYIVKDNLVYQSCQEESRVCKHHATRLESKCVARNSSGGCLNVSHVPVSYCVMWETVRNRNCKEGLQKSFDNVNALCKSNPKATYKVSGESKVEACK